MIECICHMAYVSGLNRSRTAKQLNVDARCLYLYTRPKSVADDGLIRSNYAASFAAISSERQCVRISQAFCASGDAYFGPV